MVAQGASRVATSHPKPAGNFRIIISCARKLGDVIDRPIPGLVVADTKSIRSMIATTFVPTGASNGAASGTSRMARNAGGLQTHGANLPALNGPQLWLTGEPRKSHNNNPSA
jgi:hypothetical protein